MEWNVIREHDKEDLVQSLRRAVDTYIARTTDVADWAHYREGAWSLTERPAIRPPRHVEHLEAALYRHLPGRCAYAGCSAAIDEWQRKHGQIIDIIHVMWTRAEEENKQ